MGQDRLSTALRELADRETVPAAPVDRLLQRGRRARRARAAGFTTAGFGAAAAAVAVTLGLGATATPGSTPDAAVSPGSPASLGPSGSPGSSETAAMRLVAAVDKTAQTTFRLKWTYVISQKGRRDHTETYAGAFDPVRHRGYLDGPVPGVKQLFIGDDAYVWRGRWQKSTRPEDVAMGPYGAPGQLSALELSTAPTTFLKKLRSLGKVTYAGRSGSGGAAVERYSFTYADKGDTTTGSFEVAAGMIKKVVQRTTVKSTDPKIGDRNPVNFTATADFSGHGTPVTVERPAID